MKWKGIYMFKFLDSYIEEEFCVEFMFFVGIFVFN